MATRKAILAFEGNSSDLESTFSKVGAGAKELAEDFDTSAAKARSFGGAMDTASASADTSESAFSGSADILDGLGGAFGLPTEGATNMMRSFGDLSGGFATIGPLLTGVASKLGITAAATWAYNAAQTALNFVMSMNPIGLVVIAIAALVAGFVLAWKHSETFRDIVRGAMDKVKDAAGWVLDKFGLLWDFIKGLPGKISGIGGTIVEAVSWPYRTAFNAIARLWNNTVGQLSFSVPSWVPGLGGKGFSMPNLPTFHMGGTVPGNPGQPVPIMAMAGETVSRAGAGGGTVVIQVVLDGRVITEVVHDGLLTKQRRGGALGFVAA